jgi:hypothetical protein
LSSRTYPTETDCAQQTAPVGHLILGFPWVLSHLSLDICTVRTFSAAVPHSAIRIPRWRARHPKMSKNGLPRFLVGALQNRAIRSDIFGARSFAAGQFGCLFRHPQSSILALAVSAPQRSARPPRQLHTGNANANQCLLCLSTATNYNEPGRFDSDPRLQLKQHKVKTPQVHGNHTSVPNSQIPSVATLGEIEEMLHSLVANRPSPQTLSI